MRTVKDALEAGYDWLIVHTAPGHTEQHRLATNRPDLDLIEWSKLLGEAQAHPVVGVSVAKTRKEVGQAEDAEEVFLWGSAGR